MTIDLLHTYRVEALGRILGVYRELGEDSEHYEARVSDAQGFTTEGRRTALKPLSSASLNQSSRW